MLGLYYVDMGVLFHLRTFGPVGDDHQTLIEQ